MEKNYLSYYDDINGKVVRVEIPYFKVDNDNVGEKTIIIDDELYINGDYNRLSQVLINIIKNSIESINNKGKITIKSKMRD